MVIYVILTQAARMIQRAYRRFMAKKRHLIEKELFRIELEAELLEGAPHRESAPPLLSNDDEHQLGRDHSASRTCQ